MDSTDRMSKLATLVRPYTAICRHDLRALWQSRPVRLWLAATVVLTLLAMLGNWGKLQDAPLIATLLFPYLVFPWFFVVIALGVTPVSGSQAETLADGILSRPVTRYGYLLATWAGRVITVLAVFYVVTVPAIMLVTLAKRPPAEDAVTVYGIVTTLGVVALVLTLIVSLGFLAGTLLRKPLLAAAVLIFLWYPVNFVLSTFSLEELSPISLSQATTTQLRRQWLGGDDESKTATNKEEAEALLRLGTNLSSMLFGGQTQQSKPGYFEPGKFEDFSLVRVTLGYGAGTLIAVGLAVLCFCRRDL